MRYYLDCEFNSFGGELISLALVREDGEERYYRFEISQEYHPWVAENVLSVIEAAPYVWCNFADAARDLAIWMDGDDDPVIIADWPDDIRYLCEMIILGPGRVAGFPGLKFEWHRVDAYPTELPDAVQHNALWDARALRFLFEKPLVSEAA